MPNFQLKSVINIVAFHFVRLRTRCNEKKPLFWIKKDVSLCQRQLLLSKGSLRNCTLPFTNVQAIENARLRR